MANLVVLMHAIILVHLMSKYRIIAGSLIVA